MKILKKKKLFFARARFVPDFMSIFLTRNSRIAPAIAGKAQVEMNYLPCRMFKNISYGQLGFTNVPKFFDIFKNCLIYDEDMEIMVDKVMALKSHEYVKMINDQQDICKQYTYVQHLNNIFCRI